MRAALSLLFLVVVMAIVLWLAKAQMQARPALPGVTSTPAASAPAASSPEAVGRQVEQLILQGAAQRASEAEP